MDYKRQQEILSDLKEDYRLAKSQRDAIDTKILKWKNAYHGRPYGNEIEGRSKIVNRLIKKHSEWQHANLIEPFVSTPDIVRASPVTFEDAEIAPKIEVLLNTQFCRQFNRYNFMNKALKVLDQEGTCIVRTGWEYEEKEVEVREMIEQPNPELQQVQMMAYQLMQAGRQEEAMQLQQQAGQLPPTIQVPQITTQVLAVKNQPTAMICRNEDVFIDPTCMDDIENCQFVIYRYETDMNTLKKSGMYKNLEKIEMDSHDGDYDAEDETNFEFRDKPRKKLLLYEYWGNYDIDGDGLTEPIVCSWIGETIIRLEDNPFPDKKPPFIIIPFNSIPYSLYGESNAELLDDNQRIMTALYRGIIDNLAASNNAQKGIKKGALDGTNKKRFLRGENFEYNGTPNDFYDGHFNEIPSSVYNIIQMVNQEAESVTGIATFNTGINGNSLGSTATSIRGAIDSSSTRRLNIVRNIAENLVKPLLRKWLAYDAEFMDEQAQFRITNDEFVWIKRDDLGANIDIDLSISTSDDNSAKAQELAFILQTMGNTEDAELKRVILAEIARLYRMPHLAKRIEEFQPQPDPAMQQMQELQMQMLQAQIAVEQSKAGKNEVDSGLKEAKTETEIQKARNLGSKTDKQDLDYVQQYNGTAHKQAMEKQESQQAYKTDENIIKLLEKSFNNNHI